MAEGFFEITTLRVYNDTTGMMFEYAPGGPFGDWVPYNPGAAEGDSIRVYVEVINNGADDNCRIELTGDILGWGSFFLGVGLTHITNFSFVMRNHDMAITVTTYHYV